jgi:hypothetical protein
VRASVLRRFLLGSGPLKRGCDRLEAAARVLLLALVLVSVPAALAVGTAVRADLVAEAGRQAAEATLVPAVTVEVVGPSSGVTAGARTTVSARWTTPAGVRADGVVPAPAGTRPGDPLEVWTTADGEPTRAPLTAREAGQAALVVGLVGWVGLLAAGALGYAALSWALGRHRDAGWSRDWSAVEPRWSRRVP